MKILAALDLSELSAKVVQHAEALGKRLMAEIWLLHVAEPEPDFVGWDTGSHSDRDIVAATFRNEHRQIQDFANKLRDSGLNVTALLVQGAVVETILEQSSKLNVDLLIVGSHGRGAAYRLLVGSVSAGVLRSTECPVLVVPTHP